MILPDYNDPELADERQRQREEHAAKLGYEEPIYVEYAPSFEFAVALLRKRDADGQRHNH